jgi:hypothetical protein
VFAALRSGGPHRFDEEQPPLASLAAEGSRLQPGHLLRAGGIRHASLVHGIENADLAVGLALLLGDGLFVVPALRMRLPDEVEQVLPVLPFPPSKPKKSVVVS